MKKLALLFLVVSAIFAWIPVSAMDSTLSEKGRLFAQDSDDSGDCDYIDSDDYPEEDDDSDGDDSDDSSEYDE